MTLADRINEISTNVASGIALTVVSGAVLLIRRVFTNERIINELVKRFDEEIQRRDAEAARRDDQRKEDLNNVTAYIKRVEVGVDTLTKHLLETK